MENRLWWWDFNPENVYAFHEQEDIKLLKTERKEYQFTRGFPVLGRSMSIC